MTMIVTKRYKLSQPIAFTDEMTVTIMTGQHDIVISNSDEAVVAHPVERDEKETPPTADVTVYVDEAKDLDVDNIKIPDSTGGD